MLDTKNLKPKTSHQLVGFSVIGALNTLIHLLVVIALVDGFLFWPILANGLAFMAANIFSFIMNSYWVFKQAPTWSRYRRFFLVSIIGLIAALTGSLIGEQLQWHYLLGVLLSFILMPIITFLSHKYWTWK